MKSGLLGQNWGFERSGVGFCVLSVAVQVVFACMHAWLTWFLELSFWS